MISQTFKNCYAVQVRRHRFSSSSVYIFAVTRDTAQDAHNCNTYNLSLRLFTAVHP